jgi:hypothetical protein
MESVALLAVIKNLLRIIVPKWLGENEAAEVPVVDMNALQVFGADGLDSDEDPDIVPTPPLNEVSSLPAAMPTDVKRDTCDQSADFFQKKRNLAMSFAKEDPRGDMILMCICNKYMDKGLRRKLYVSGDTWKNQNDIDSAAGKQRSYRVLEAARNQVEEK